MLKDKLDNLKASPFIGDCRKSEREILFLVDIILFIAANAGESRALAALYWVSVSMFCSLR